MLYAKCNVPMLALKLTLILLLLPTTLIDAKERGGGGDGGLRKHTVSLFAVSSFTPTNLIHVLHIPIFKHPLRSAVVDITPTKLGILLYHLFIFRK